MELKNTIALRPALLLAAVLLGACGDDGDSDSTSEEGQAGHEGHEDAGEVESDPDAGPPPARYVFATQVFTGETAITQIVASDSASPGKLSLSDSLAVPGRAIVAASGEDNYVFVGSGDSPVLKRYELSEDDELVEGPSVSFQGKGVGGIGEYQTQFQFISETKAYYFDAKSAQAVVWNPKTMRVTSSIDLSELSSPNHIIAFASTPARRGSQVVMPVGFRSLNNAQIIKKAAVVLIDSDDDSVEIARDDRCGYVRDAVALADGTIYAATEAYGAAVHRLNSANAEPPCLLRIPAGEQSFDVNFHVDLNELVGGKTVGSLAVTPAGETYVKVLDEKLTNIMPMTSPRALASAAAWTWSQITLGDQPKLKAVPALPPTAGSIIWFKAEDTLLVAEFVNMSESSKLRNLSDGSGDVVVESPGLLFSVAQVR
jgi:hypothetical protein